MYEGVNIDIESEDLEDWQEQLRKFGLSKYLEQVIDYDGYHSLYFETNESNYLVDTLKLISDKHVLYIREIYYD